MQSQTKAVTDAGNAPRAWQYPKFSICRNGKHTQLITVTRAGRFGDVLASVLTGFEGNIRNAIAACEQNDIENGIRIFRNLP